MPEPVAHCETLRQVVLRVAGIARRELDDDHAQGRTDAAVERRIGRLVGIEVHVVQARHAATQHLGGGEQRAVVDELRGHVLRFGRPDVLLEPAPERQVVRHAAHERHGCMGVSIDETGDQRVVRQIDAGNVGPCSAGRGGGHDSANVFPRDGNGMSL